MKIPEAYLPQMTPRLFRALEVLTGFAESQRDKGIAYAPAKHIDDAREILRDTYEDVERYHGAK
jgi:hypothetical protein